MTRRRWRLGPLDPEAVYWNVDRYQCSIGRVTVRVRLHSKEILYVTTYTLLQIWGSAYQQSLVWWRDRIGTTGIAR